jgi:hypothetical protein
MAERERSLIELAKGPYEVNAYSGPLLAETIAFRHFRPMELYLAKEFIRKAIIPGTYYFDVYLLTEEAKDFMIKNPEAFWRMAIPYAHRIDAVCFTEEKIYLIEFKIRLKYSAIGQLQGYLDWFKRDYHPTKPVELVVVVAYDRPELHETCERLGIKLIKLR